MQQAQEPELPRAPSLTAPSARTRRTETVCHDVPKGSGFRPVDAVPASLTGSRPTKGWREREDQHFCIASPITGRAAIWVDDVGPCRGGSSTSMNVVTTLRKSRQASAQVCPTTGCGPDGEVGPAARPRLVTLGNWVCGRYRVRSRSGRTRKRAETKDQRRCTDRLAPRSTERYGSSRLGR